MSEFVSNLSFWFAICISMGSLLLYLSGAIWNRPINRDNSGSMFDFNLGLPETNKPERLFAISLVAAGTSLSTVFVFFLTSVNIFGWWLVISPILFAIGNLVMFWVYSRIKRLGYFDESHENATKGAAGLVPYISQHLTGHIVVGWLLVLLSLINLFSVLVLELVVGAEVLGYLITQNLIADSSSIGEFIVFCIFIGVLIAYVFIGGFRAVITSDIWQVKAIKWALFLTIVSLIVFGFSTYEGKIAINSLSKSPPWILLGGFILNVILANLFIPFSQEASWQRFRAFSDIKTMNFAKAILNSVTFAVILWFGLIILAFILHLMISNGPQDSLISMSSVLETLRTLNIWWFPLFVFPVITFATLSAMFSTSDTNISALFFLIRYTKFIRPQDKTGMNDRSFPKPYIAASAIFIFSIMVYFFVRIWFHPTILQLIFSVFSNLIIIAPTIITSTILKPLNIQEKSKFRFISILISLCLGFVCYWSCSIIAIMGGEEYLWLSQLSIAIGLLGALLPCLPLWINHYLIKSKR